MRERDDYDINFKIRICYCLAIRKLFLESIFNFIYKDMSIVLYSFLLSLFYKITAGDIEKNHYVTTRQELLQEAFLP